MTARWNDDALVAKRLGVTVDQLTRRVGVARRIGYVRTHGSTAAIDLVVDERRAKCALVMSAAVPPLTFDVTPVLGKHILKEIPITTATQFSRARHPAPMPGAFFKLVAVHAVNAIEGRSVSLNPAIAIALRCAFPAQTLLYHTIPYQNKPWHT